MEGKHHHLLHLRWRIQQALDPIFFSISCSFREKMAKMIGCRPPPKEILDLPLTRVTIRLYRELYYLRSEIHNWKLQEIPLDQKNDIYTAQMFLIYVGIIVLYSKATPRADNSAVHFTTPRPCTICSLKKKNCHAIN